MTQEFHDYLKVYDKSERYCLLVTTPWYRMYENKKKNIKVKKT